MKKTMMLYVQKLLHPKLISGILIFISLFFQGCTKDIKAVKGKDISIQSKTSTGNLLITQPNIILVVADDLGYEIPSFLGGQSYETPTLDFMARNGMQFRQCYCHPDGYPSRLAMQTGKYNFRNYTKWGILPFEEKTIGNMLHDGGYATCFAGKWQCDGGDERIRAAGYDKYRVFVPYNKNSQKAGRYKDPILYENASYLPTSLTYGKFSEDLMYDYLSHFIDSNKTKPFFAVYSHTLVARPWVPSPDDPDYAGWNTAHDVRYDVEHEDMKYFPGMVKYMDKIVGQIIKKVKDAGLAEKTIILFTADNATKREITSQFKGMTVTGGKLKTTKEGTSIPFVAYMPGTILPGQVNTDLVDFTDFLPSLADMAGLPKPTGYGTLDGVSFYDNLLNINGENRSWVFCHWFGDTQPLIRFVNDKVYKMYDSTNGNKFYNMQKDIYELNPIPDSSLTPHEKLIKLEFEQVFSEMHK